MTVVERSFTPMQPPHVPNSTNKWPDCDKVRAVSLSERLRVIDVAYLFDVHPHTVSRWRRQKREGWLQA